MKKIRRVKITICILSIITILLWISGKSKYILSICQYIPYPNIIYYFVILTGSVTCFILLPLKREPQMSYVLVISVCLVVCFLIWYSFLLIERPKVTCKESPDGKHDIVFIEYDHMFSDLCYVYEKVSPFYMERIGEFNEDLGAPIYNDKLLLEWNETNFIISPLPGKFFDTKTIPYADQ